MKIERIDNDVVSQWIRIGLVQLTFTPQLSLPHHNFGWYLDDSEKQNIRKKIFSALDVAKSESVNIVCFPELSFSREWISQVKTEYQDMIVIGGSYYNERYNICPVIVNGTEYPIRKIHPSPNTEGEVEPGRGMKSGDEVVIFHTKFGRFVVLICLDYREEAHAILTSTDESIRGVDFIFNPSYNADIANFQERANQDCQMGNYPYIIQVNGMGAGSCIFCMDHNVALDRYKLEGYKAFDDDYRYKLLQTEGEMMAIVDLDIRRKAVPIPATGLKMKTRGRYTYGNQAWQKFRFKPEISKSGQKSGGSPITTASTEGERKQATVLYASVSGLNAISEKLDPEEVANVMNDFFRMIEKCVEQHGGTIDKFMGDGVMALFGVPRALEDAPRRALNAALEIRVGMEKFSTEKHLAVPLAVTIGINTGAVVTGMAGSDKKQDFTVMGDAVNLAKHLTDNSSPGVIQVSENTYRHTEGYFDFEDLGVMKIKGKKMPVKAYNVLGSKQVKTRLAASQLKGLTPFVGRKLEMEHIRDYLEKTMEGHGQVVGVVGEPGIGKSRLIHEFIQTLPTEEYAVLEGGCIHYGEEVLYLPILEILRACFKIREDEDEAVIKDKLKTKTAEFPGQLAHILPPLYEVLSLKAEDVAFSMLEPRLKRDKVFEAIRLVLIAESQKKPLLVVVEDLHWIDKNSEEFLTYLIGGLANNRIMLVLLFRHEYTPLWTGKSYYSQISLDQLSRKTSTDLIRLILAGADVEPGLSDFILNKSEGNPLFIEELTRDLIEGGSVKKTGNRYALCCTPAEIQIPDTIQGIIAARLDRLEENLKRVLQVASVIGRDFSFRILKEAGDFGDSLKSSLLTLQNLEFIYEKTMLPDLDYNFKHALTREVAYNSLLMKRRKETHEKVGQTIEQIYADRLEEFYEMIAYHFFMSENFTKAAEYYRMAGKKALKTGVLSFSINHAKKRVACLEKLPMTNELQKMIIDARTVLGLYLAQLNYFVEANEATDPIFDSALELGYTRRLSQIQVIRGSYYSYIEENFQSGFQAFEEALKTSGEAKDIISTYLAMYYMSMDLALCCEFDRAISYTQRLIDSDPGINNLWGITAKAFLSFLCYFHQGKINLGISTAADAVRMVEDSSIILVRVYDAHIAYGYCCLAKGMFEEAEKNFLKGVEFSELNNEHVWKSNALQGLGEIYFETGNYTKSRESFEASYRSLEQNRVFPSLAGWSKLGAMRAQVRNSKTDVDLESLYIHSHNNKMKLVEGCIAKFIGEILLYIDDQHHSEAEQWILKAIGADQRNGMRFYLGRDYALYAEFFRRKGDSSKARENLVKAIEILKECGADGWVAKYERELEAI